MLADFSEFTFGYAITEELINHTRLHLASHPIFPSLRDEGTTGGYDVALDFVGLPLFLQFKLADCMVRSNAGEISYYRIYPNPPFFRMHLRPLKNSRQHDLLLNLESINPGRVYYVCPAFYLVGEMNDFYLRKEVLRNSRFIRPSSIGSLPDIYDHHISFRADDNYFYFFSEPKLTKENMNFEFIEETLLTKLFQEKKLAFTTLKETYENMLNIIKEDKDFKNLDYPREFETPIEYYNKITYLAISCFDSQVLWLNKGE